MSSTNPNSRTRRQRLIYKEDLKSFQNTIYTIARMEYSRINGSYLIDFNELIAIGTVVVNDLMRDNKAEYNNSYISTAIKWAIRNELRRRYKWYVSKDESNDSTKGNKENAYMSVLSINELSEQENPIQFIDTASTPDKVCEMTDMRKLINKSLKKLPEREKHILERRFYYDRKIKEIADEFEISPSRISRIIQTGLERIKKDLERQEAL